MRFYPIAYHSYEDRRGTGIIIFAVEKTDNPQTPFRKVALKFRYTHWFYVSLENHTYDEVRNTLVNLTGVHIDAPKPGEDVSTVIQQRNSTINPHMSVNVVRVHADQYLAKQEAMRILSNYRIRVHEADNMLTPTLKMLAEKDVKKYQWMDVECEMAANIITKWQYEFAANVDTLRPCPESIPPPPFSIMSFDIETDSDNINKPPDAKTSMGNAIRVMNLTYVDKIEDRYEEYVLVFGYDVTDAFKRFSSQDLESKDGKKPAITVLVFTDELDMLRKFFDLIDELDPSVLTGHNILGFDNDYIFNRYKLLVMNKMCKGTGTRSSVRLPNISRLREHSCSVQPVEWNNSQVAMKGMYFNAPGRIWVDTLVVAARGLLGNMENKKLDTLAKVHLGMAKNDVSYKDMFMTFRLTRDWEASRTATGAEGLKMRDSIQSIICNLYVQMVNKHNKKDPPLLQNPTINHINTVIGIINSMNQRGKKMKMYAQTDMLKLDVKEEYNKVRAKCIEVISSWNIPLEEDLSIEERLRVMWWLIAMYCLQDTRIPFQILEQQSIAQVLAEQSSVFSVDINDVLMRGQVFTVTASQYSYNYKMGRMVDFGNPGGPTGQYEYEGGYVGKGEPGLKITDNDTVIVTLDFASLYPTIIIAYNICYTTWVSPNMMKSHKEDGSINKDYIWLQYESVILKNKVKYERELEAIKGNDKYKEEIETLERYIHELDSIIEAPYEKKGDLMCYTFKVPNPHSKTVNEWSFLRECISRGTLPGMLWEQYKARKAIKRSMGNAKKEGNMAMYITYNAQQLAVKVSMNASYGALGTATNRLACYPGAETITYVGRTGILKCNDFIGKNNPDDDVVYNDTDSGFVRLKKITQRFNRSVKAIKDYGNDLAAKIANLFPKPMGMEMENIFLAFVLKKSKHYAGITCDGESLDISHYTWDYITMFKLLYVKGMTPVRGDKFKYNKDVFNKVLYNILVRSGPDAVISILEYALQQIWNQRNNVKNIAMLEQMFSYNMGITPTALEGGSGAMAKWVSIYESKYGIKPSPGEKFRLLVTNVSSGPDAGKHTKAATKMVTAEWFTEESRTLDVQHYIEALDKDGNVVDLMSIAYPENIHRGCVKKWYLPKLKRDNHLRDE